MSLDKNYEIIIQPNRSWIYVDWKGLAHYKDLLVLLVQRDFISKYKQTVLGPAWFFLQPLMTTMVFFIIFGKAVRVPTDGVPPFLFYLCGLIPWGYFSQTLNAVSFSLSSNTHILGKVYFPRLIIPLAVVFSNLVAFGIQLATFLLFYLGFKFFTPTGALIHPSPVLLLFPLLILQVALLALGVGLWVAALTVKYRDFHHLLSFVTQIWMYATPIIYPSSLIPQKWRFIMMLNPMAPIIELTRFAFFGKGLLNFNALASSLLITVIFLVVGVLVFNKVERSFIDTI